MSNEAELIRLTKENDNFRKIIKTQQNTIERLINYFILEPKDETSDRTGLRL